MSLAWLKINFSQFKDEIFLFYGLEIDTLSSIDFETTYSCFCLLDSKEKEWKF